MVLYVESTENGEAGDKDDQWLPDLIEGEVLSLGELTPAQHFTQPPPRYSEASLIKELEERGIGRPSTYAAIVSTIMDREYIIQQKQRLYPTELGRLIHEILVENFPKIVDVEFTANMEKSLDEVERGEHPYVELLHGFYEEFARTLESAESHMLNLKTEGWPTELPCPVCGKPLHIKLSRNGAFIGCSDYPSCTFTSDYERDEKGMIHLAAERPTGEACDKCGRPMVMKKGRFGVFYACSGYPECRNTRPVTLGVHCPREGCDGELVERTSKKGRRFYGCTKYPECKISYWHKPVGASCPLCCSPILLEKQTRGGTLRWVCPQPGCTYDTRVTPVSGPENGEKTGT
jgi:DNA topoisomerase-1